MTQPIPMCKAGLVCEYTSHDLKTNKWSVCGMYDLILIDQYPSPSRDINWYCKLADVHGRYEIEPRILNPDGQVIARMPVGFIEGIPPLFGSEFGGTFRQVIFQIPGPHTLSIVGVGTDHQKPGDFVTLFTEMGQIRVPKKNKDRDIIVSCEFHVMPLSQLEGR